MYTDSEVDGYATIIDGATDAFWNIGMYGTALGFRLSTNHVYYDGPVVSLECLTTPRNSSRRSPTVDPRRTVRLPPEGLTLALAVNQATGRVFVMNGCYVTWCRTQRS